MSRSKFFGLTCNPPGENVFAGIRIGKSAELSDHNALLRDGSYIRVSSDKPTQRKE